MVLVSKHDHAFATLENWAVNDVDSKNRNWGFCVYGTGDGVETAGTDSHQPTYHDALTCSGGYGNIALTLVCRLTRRSCN